MLKQLFAFFFLVLPAVLLSQVNDDFSDGDFDYNPSWQGNGPAFIVNSSGQLQLNSSGTDTSYLSTPFIANQNAEWSCWVKLSFAPSDNNYVRIYLMADQSNLKAPLNGYYISMGENGSFDSVDLWEQSGTTHTKIIDGINGRCAAPTNTLRIKITRDSTGLWKLYSDTLGGNNFVHEGSIINSTHSSSSHMGVFCRYTTTNAMRFYFDDFYAGGIRIDTIKPRINSVYVASANKLNVYFDEPVDETSAQDALSYSVNGGVGSPVTALRDAGNHSLVYLQFAQSFAPSQTYELTALNVADKNGNAASVLNATFVLPHRTEINDIVINELLPDPLPGGVDFIELYNRSQKVLDLSTLKITSYDTLTRQLKSSYLIVNSRRLFYPDDYVVLSSNTAAVKNQYYTANAIGFIQLTSIPAMNISDGAIALVDTGGVWIDNVSYSQKMHFPLLTQTKGVSLERVNPHRSSYDKTNWHSASSAVGYATPAYKNSQYANEKFNGVISVSPEIFSPDNDGRDDVLNISYAFENSGNVLTVSVYDRNGRLMRLLVNNQLAGVMGTLSWDGLTDSYEKAPIGPYLIQIQVFNSSGESFFVKKSCVLAGILGQ